MYHVLIYVVFPIAAIAPRPAESLMPPPPAPAVVANQTPASAGAPPPSGTVTRQSAMNPQGISTSYSHLMEPMIGNGWEQVVVRRPGDVPMLSRK